MKTKSSKNVLYLIIVILIVFIVYREYTFYKNSQEVNDIVGFQNLNSIKWAEENPELLEKIERFIDKNKNINQPAFIEDVINAENANVDIDLEDGFIGDMHTDDILTTDFTFDNFIPKKLKINDNTGKEYEIDVFFGRTDSDDMSAYQKVSNYVISALKHGLAYANNHLYNNEKIASIYIKCTINGKRAGPSNHPYGNAIDISRINGKRMLSTGVTRQIVLLQDGFNSYQYIRENFGPAYKHKYSMEVAMPRRWNRKYPISGHKDHIHISVRK